MNANNIRIILDKSLLQALPSGTFTPLDRHFNVVIPPILIKEIVGDLTKTSTNPDDIQRMADRFGVNSIVCPPYDFMVHQSLLGVDIPLDGRILPAGIVPVRSADGRFGHHIVDTPFDESISKWQSGEFTVEDAFFSYRWQKIKRTINSALYTTRLEAAGAIIEIPRNLERLNSFVNDILAQPKFAGTLLGLLYIEFKPSHYIQVQALNRWNATGRPLIRDFAPYAEHCLRANLLLALGRLNENVLGSHHDHDLRDLEYCYYLPFCEVFASKDKIHKKLVNLLRRSNQRFVGAELEVDLRRLSDEWFALTPEQKKARHFEHGNRPPSELGTCVSDLWEELRPNRHPNFEGIQHALVSDPDGKTQTFGEFLKELGDKISVAPRVNEHLPIESGSYLYRSRLVSKAKLKELFPQIDFEEID